ncbi:hypothetical protein [Shouchella clausii]|jgi:hypothetical protein|uniref:Uncharacterized protein n=1 Tax=Shouchella clausii TaxID=79880 RepID=A0A268NWA1_SHOCL|nr:hypothetical protein [Shouchella clausii]PAE87807.1 hypothetical protein CHH72_16380 [Shouchella clausii]PAF27277.1 hypothetical protein CHH61_04285 [Shouchella clausii]
MAKNKAEITLKISVVEAEKGKEPSLSVTIGLEGTNHEVMNIAEIAQNMEILGEVGVENILLYILKKEGDVFRSDCDGPIH